MAEEVIKKICNVCGRQMVQVSRHIIGWRRGFLTPDRIIYAVTLKCPQRLGINGIFFRQHSECEIILNSYDEKNSA